MGRTDRQQDLDHARGGDAEALGRLMNSFRPCTHVIVRGVAEVVR